MLPSYKQNLNTISDPRIISCDVEYNLDYLHSGFALNPRQEAIATIKMRVDPNNFDANNPLPLTSPINTFGTLLKEGNTLIFQHGEKKTVLGDVSDPETFSKIYFCYIDDLYSK